MSARSGKTVTEAQARAYQAVDRINWPEGFCRRDIGWQAVEAEKARGLTAYSCLRRVDDCAARRRHSKNVHVAAS